MSNNDFWQDVEKNIGNSIERAIDSEDFDFSNEKDSGTDFTGGDNQPPGNDADGGDGNGSYPARSTLVIDIRP